MKLKNILIVVRDIQRSKKFYCDLFGLSVLKDFGENVILSEGLVLQAENAFQEVLNRPISYRGNDAELYFEDSDLCGFIKKWGESIPDSYVYDQTEGVLRMYDPDGHMIEIRERKANYS